MDNREEYDAGQEMKEVETREVPEQLSHLAGLLGELEVSISRLEDQLRPVLPERLEEEADGRDDKKNIPLVPVAEMIRIHCHTTNKIMKRVVCLQRNVQV